MIDVAEGLLIGVGAGLTTTLILGMYQWFSRYLKRCEQITYIREFIDTQIRVRQMTLANFTNLPQPLIEGFKAVLKGGTMFTQNDDAVTVEQSLPHSHMTAALGMVRALELPRPLHRQN